MGGPTSLMKIDTLFTFIWAKWPSSYSRAAKIKQIIAALDLKMISKYQFESKDIKHSRLTSLSRKTKFTQNCHQKRTASYTYKQMKNTEKRMTNFSISSAVIIFLLKMHFFGLFC